MNNEGQITVEYILLIAMIMLIVLLTASVLVKESEKNTILNSAQIGAQIGVDKNAYAMYYNDTFKEYEENYVKLLYPSELKVINITMNEMNDTLRLKAYIHTNNYLTNNERYIVGSRINYYIRKTVSETFNQENNDLFYNNLKSYNFKIETEEVGWV
jgi:uncharacterized protein (UPF0333 family)